MSKGDHTLALGTTEQIVAEDQVNIQLNTIQQQPGEYIPGITHLTNKKYFSTFKDFFTNIVNKARLPTDVYSFMFLCDFINFFVLLFGFTSFGVRLFFYTLEKKMIVNAVFFYSINKETVLMEEFKLT